MRTKQTKTTKIERVVSAMICEMWLVLVRPPWSAAIKTGRRP
ncbi:hypothetical protein [Streptomyces sp. NPDC001312]